MIIKHKEKSREVQAMTNSELKAELAIWQLRASRRRLPTAAAFAKSLVKELASEARRRGLKVPA